MLAEHPADWRRSDIYGKGNMVRASVLTFICFLSLCDAAISDVSQADSTRYMETLRPDDTKFVTSITRITKCQIAEAHNPRELALPYPVDAQKHKEQGKALLQLIIDSDFCVRKATILLSSGYYRLDKSGLDFAMNLKFPTSMLTNFKTLDDGQLTFKMPLAWNLIVQKPYVPGDRCAYAPACFDEAPPPDLVEEPGPAPEPSDVWMPGYYAHYARTGYQWNEGHWEEARPGHHWEPPHWEKFKSKWVFDAGRWESDEKHRS
jgi:hypothetical protein